MANLFEEINDLSKVVGGGINNSIIIEDITPTIDNAARKYIIPWLGEVYTSIKEKVLDPGTVDYTTQELAFIPYIQRALGNFTMFEYVAIGAVKFSGSGLVRSESETVKSAYKYQANEYKDSMIENGYEALEEAILFLEKNAADYPLWTGETRVKSMSLFVNFAREFRDKYSSHITRRTFEILRPIIEDLEEFSILPAVGDTLFYDLKTKVAAKTLSTFEKRAIHYIQKALTSFAIREGIKRFWIRMEGEKVVYNERSDSQSMEYERIATPNQMELLAKSDALVGNRYISRLIAYLDQHAEEFEGWPLPKEDAAEEEVTGCEIAKSNPGGHSKVYSF